MSNPDFVGFVCPECGATRLEEISTCDFVTSPIAGMGMIPVRGGEADLEYGMPKLEGDINVERYQCVRGHILTDKHGTVDDLERLGAWLVAQREKRVAEKVLDNRDQIS